MLAKATATTAAAEAMPFGMLSMLNVTEDECLNYVYLRTLATGVLMMEELADSELMVEEEGTEDAEMDVDVVFWTRTSKATEALADLEGEQRDEAFAALFGEMTDMEAEAIESYDAIGGREALYAYAASDMPEGTVATDPYYST